MSLPHPMLLNWSGDAIVPMYDWSSYFDEHTIKTSLKGITQMHHFKFTKSKPGKVFVRTTQKTLKEITLMKDISYMPSDLPQQILPPGLSTE